MYLLRVTSITILCISSFVKVSHLVQWFIWRALKYREHSDLAILHLYNTLPLFVVNKINTVDTLIRWLWTGTSKRKLTVDSVLWPFYNVFSFWLWSGFSLPLLISLCVCVCVCVLLYLDPQFKLSLFYVQWIHLLHDRYAGGGFLDCLSGRCKV
jgi:hypothetical protein